MCGVVLMNAPSLFYTITNITQVQKKAIDPFLTPSHHKPRAQISRSAPLFILSIKLIRNLDIRPFLTKFYETSVISNRSQLLFFVLWQIFLTYSYLLTGHWARDSFLHYNSHNTSYLLTGHWARDNILHYNSHNSSWECYSQPSGVLSSYASHEETCADVDR